MSDQRPPLADDEVCPGCGHLGVKHYRNPEGAQRWGCMVLVDSTWTVTNNRTCGCSRLRAPDSEQEKWQKRSVLDGVKPPHPLALDD